MAKQNWKPGNMLYPVPVVMVSTKKKGANERPNIVTVAWAGTICSDPVMLSISVRPERYSHEIIEETGAKIDIMEDGKVFVASYEETIEPAEKAKAIIMSIARDLEVGDMFITTVARILPKVGAFCELTPGHDGMIHISKLGTKEKVNSVEDVLAIGDKVKVEIIKIGEKGIDLKLLEKING